MIWKEECLEDGKVFGADSIAFFLSAEERKMHPQHLDSVPNMAESLLILLKTNKFNVSMPPPQKGHTDITETWAIASGIPVLDKSYTYIARLWTDFIASSYYIQYLVTQTTIFSWMFRETPIVHVRISFIIQLKQAFTMVGHLVNQVYIKFTNPATEVSRFRAAQDSLPFEGPREETPSRLRCCTWCSWEWRKSLGRVYRTKFDHVYQAWSNEGKMVVSPMKDSTFVWEEQTRKNISKLIWRQSAYFLHPVFFWLIRCCVFCPLVGK